MPNVNEKLTFGIELEVVAASPDEAHLRALRGFARRYDHSIRADNGNQLGSSIETGGGSEFITPPLTVDVRMNNVGERLSIVWGDTHDIVRDLCRCAAHVNRSCGVHIHLGRPSREGLTVSKWEPERVRTMLTIGMMLEPKIFDVMPESRRNNHHCNTIRSRYSENDLGQFYPVGAVVARKYNNPKRYCWMNLIETRRVGEDPRPGRGSSTALGTIEIRALGNTASSEYIIAWLTLWMKVAAYVAYLPSSLAIMRCCMTQTFEDDFSLLAKLKTSVQEAPVQPTVEPPLVSLGRATAEFGSNRSHRIVGTQTGRSTSRPASNQTQETTTPWTVDPITEAQNVQ